MERRKLLIPKFSHIKFALKGIWTGLTEEAQVLWAFIAGAVMSGVMLWQNTAKGEAIAFVGLTAIVMALEMINGAIERLADKVEPDRDESIKKVKDLASGAVLLISLFTLSAWIIFVFF